MKRIERTRVQFICIILSLLSFVYLYEFGTSIFGSSECSEKLTQPQRLWTDGDAYTFKPKDQLSIGESDVVVAIFSGDSFIETRVRVIVKTWRQHFTNIVVFADSNRFNDTSYGVKIVACCPNAIYTNIGLTQYKWKYIPMKLYEMYPNMQYYLFVDDDTYVYKRGFLAYLHSANIPRPDENVVVISKFVAFTKKWSERRCTKIAQALNTEPELVGCLKEDFMLIPGGIMFFTHRAIHRLADPILIQQCIDDLNVLDSQGKYPFGGRYQIEKNNPDNNKTAYYNQDHLFSWCIQGRSRGKVLKSAAFYFYGGNILRGFRKNVLVEHFFGEGRDCYEKDWWETGLVAVHQIKDPKVISWIHKQCFIKNRMQIEEAPFGSRITWNTTSGKKLEHIKLTKKGYHELGANDERELAEASMDILEPSRSEKDMPAGT